DHIKSFDLLSLSPRKNTPSSRYSIPPKLLIRLDSNRTKNSEHLIQLPSRLAVLERLFLHQEVSSKIQQLWVQLWASNNGAGFETQERIKAIKLNDPNYRSTIPILLSYKPESIDETQKLFDSIPITTDITISKSSNEVCEDSSCNNMVEKSVTKSSQLPSSVLIQNQSNNSKQFSSITKAKKELPESLISLSSEYLIKHKSDISTLILLLQQKFQMSKEKLEQW
ncbi:12286_t:CDS:2, partial [Cetraspora pellucida]